jgi:hypothetical protein
VGSLGDGLIRCVCDRKFFAIEIITEGFFFVRRALIDSLFEQVLLVEKQGSVNRRA